MQNQFAAKASFAKPTATAMFACAAAASAHVAVRTLNASLSVFLILAVLCGILISLISLISLLALLSRSPQAERS